MVCSITFFIDICDHYCKGKWNHFLVPIYISLMKVKLNIFSQQILQGLHVDCFI